MKEFHKINFCFKFNTGMQIVHMGGQCCKKLPVNNFAWIKGTSQFNENFIKNYNEESDEG